MGRFGESQRPSPALDVGSPNGNISSSWNAHHALPQARGCKNCLISDCVPKGVPALMTVAGGQDARGRRLMGGPAWTRATVRQEWGGAGGSGDNLGGKLSAGMWWGDDF